MYLRRSRSGSCSRVTPGIAHRTHNSAKSSLRVHQHGSRRRWGCGLLWSCAAASLRCNASRARLVFQWDDPAGTKWHRWVRGCVFPPLLSFKVEAKRKKERENIPLQRFWTLFFNVLVQNGSVWFYLLHACMGNVLLFCIYKESAVFDLLISVFRSPARTPPPP